MNNKTVKIGSHLFWCDRRRRQQCHHGCGVGRRVGRWRAYRSWLGMGVRDACNPPMFPRVLEELNWYGVFDHMPMLEMLR